MTSTQKLKWLVLATLAELKGSSAPEYPCANVDQLFEEAKNADDDWFPTALDEVRCGGLETSIACEFSRHYESASVAQKLPDGSWVGWMYWYGGGKHGAPESVPWLNDAYPVACHEEEKLVVVRTFTKEQE